MSRRAVPKANGAAARSAEDHPEMSPQNAGKAHGPAAGRSVP